MHGFKLIPLVVLVAGCAARRPAPPLAGPSSAPVYVTPAAAALLAAPTEADWAALGDEATALLSQYLRINTTNPPGNEIVAARWLAQVLRRAHVPLRRDIIFLATSDEEIGAGVGAAWIAEQQAPLVKDAEFLLNEGGLTRADGHGGVEFYGIGTTEKSPFWLDVTAHGTAGHGSRPTPDNPVHRLVRALQRIANWQTPLIVTPAAERSFRELPSIERDSTVRRRLTDIRS